MADNSKLSKPGLIPVKVENQGSLITTQVNKINFTGSGVTASVGQFNDLTILITGGGGSGVSSSYALTASWAATASYFSGSISNAISSSYALTASYFSGSISNAVSSSYALSASYALTSSYWSGSILNAVSSSYALSSSNALTASYALNASSFPYTGSARITGSLGITGSTSLSGSAGTGSALLIYKSGSTVLDIQGSQGQLFSVVDTLTGSLMSVNDVSGLPILEVFSDDKVVLGTYGAPGLTVTGSQFFGTGSITGSLTGSLLGTGSWAVSASQAITASYVLNAISASYAVSSSFATTASYAYSASYEIVKEVSSSYADTASYLTPLSQSVLITGSIGLTGSLNIYKSGSTVVDVQGSSGQLFSITDSLTGSLFSVNTVAGLPVIEAFSDNTVNVGKFGVYPIKVAATGTLAVITGSLTGSITGSLLGTSSFATTASWALNSRLLNGTASSVFATTGSNVFLGNQTITGSTNISGAFNLVGDINASSTTIILNSPSVALPGLALPYSPSPTVNTVMFDTANNVLFVTSSLPGGGGGSGLADRIQTGSITASVAIGSNPLYPHFFLLQSSSRELLKFNTEGVMQLEAYYTTPTAITGGFMYSASGDFFVGL
jgi:hypothetical protein